MQLTYDPPAQLPQGLELHWGIPYGTCTFENALVTVHSGKIRRLRIDLSVCIWSTLKVEAAASLVVLNFPDT